MYRQSAAERKSMRTRKKKYEDSKRYGVREREMRGFYTLK